MDQNKVNKCEMCEIHLTRIEELERQNEQLKILLEQSKWSVDEDVDESF